MGRAEIYRLSSWLTETLTTISQLCKQGIISTILFTWASIVVFTLRINTQDTQLNIKTAVNKLGLLSGGQSHTHWLFDKMFSPGNSTNISLARWIVRNVNNICLNVWFHDLMWFSHGKPHSPFDFKRNLSNVK